MGRQKPKDTGHGPISKKVLSLLQKASDRKVVDFAAWKNSKICAENINNTIISEKKLSKLDPLHGVYIYAQNKISAFAEQLSELPALSKIVDAYDKAEKLYLPSGPPMSPLTSSYFTCWGFFDLCIGAKKESFGTVVIDVCRALNADPGLITLFECLLNSRMGFFVHEGFSGKFVMLREIITQRQSKAIVPSGYLGQPGEIWFARVVPEPFPSLNYGYSIVFTTPYVILEMKNDRFVFADVKKWESFFERNLNKTNIPDSTRAYEVFMKYGLNRHYWNEYIFEAYVNHRHEMILLAGFPDIPLSRPHSQENIDRE